VDDLYLAIACGAGDAGALALFERERMAPLGRQLARVEHDTAVLDELLQRGRVRVLVGDGERGPRLGGYARRGSLLGWPKFMAVRLRANQGRDEQRSAEPRSGFDHVAAAQPGPEQLFADGRYRGVLSGALRGAFADLSARQRALLRLHYVDGATLERIGAM